MTHFDTLLVACRKAMTRAQRSGCYAMLHLAELLGIAKVMAECSSSFLLEVVTEKRDCPALDDRLGKISVQELRNLAAMNSVNGVKGLLLFDSLLRRATLREKNVVTVREVYTELRAAPGQTMPRRFAFYIEIARRIETGPRLAERLVLCLQEREKYRCFAEQAMHEAIQLENDEMKENAGQNGPDLRYQTPQVDWTSTVGSREGMNRNIRRNMSNEANENSSRSLGCAQKIRGTPSNKRENPKTPTQSSTTKQTRSANSNQKSNSHPVEECLTETFRATKKTRLGTSFAQNDKERLGSFATKSEMSADNETSVTPSATFTLSGAIEQCLLVLDRSCDTLLAFKENSVERKAAKILQKATQDIIQIANAGRDGTLNIQT